MPTKAPPPSSTPHDWLAWVTVRGTVYLGGTFGNDLKGDQVDVLAGLTRRISANFMIGAFGGYEHFDYTSQAFTARLKGDAGLPALIWAGNSRRTSAWMPAPPGRTFSPMTRPAPPTAISPARDGS
jgi:hypothetical protein